VQGECAVCTFTIRNLDTAHSVNNLTVQNEFTFGSGNINVGTCLQGGNPVTVLGAGGSATDSCGGSFEECTPISCSDQPELMIDEVRAAGTDAGPAPFTGLPATGSTQNAILVSPLVCGDPPECNTVTCVPGPTPGPGVGCVVTPAFDSTPCGTDTDGNDCTAPGCEAGTCVQTHILDPESTVCGTDTTPTDCTAPGCTATGVCSQTHNDVPVSTTCGTDSDGNDCTAPGCDGAGTCVQTHTLDPVSTACGTDTDATDCTTPGCTAPAQGYRTIG
jgi:hypothetical protein